MHKSLEEEKKTRKVKRKCIPPNVNAHQSQAQPHSKTNHHFLRTEQDKTQTNRTLTNLVSSNTSQKVGTARTLAINVSFNLASQSDCLKMDFSYTNFDRKCCS